MHSRLITQLNLPFLGSKEGDALDAARGVATPPLEEPQPEYLDATSPEEVMAIRCISVNCRPWLVDGDVHVQ